MRFDGVSGSQYRTDEVYFPVRCFLSDANNHFVQSYQRDVSLVEDVGLTHRPMQLASYTGIEMNPYLFLPSTPAQGYILHRFPERITEIPTYTVGKEWLESQKRAQVTERIFLVAKVLNCPYSTAIPKLAVSCTEREARDFNTTMISRTAIEKLGITRIENMRSSNLGSHPSRYDSFLSNEERFEHFNAIFPHNPLPIVAEWPEEDICAYR